MRYINLGRFKLADDTGDTAFKRASDELVQEASKTWDLPSPLHKLAFYPAESPAPTHFAYGGEQIPLSLWSITQLLVGKREGNAGTNENETQSESNQSGKRKKASQSNKNRALLFGEVWRAKNVSVLLRTV